MKKNPHELGLGTLVTHFTEKDNPHQAHIAPIYQTSTFVFPDVQTGADIFAGKNKGFSYTRADNPNARQLAKKLAALEGIDLLRANPDAEIDELVKGRMFSSGMAAITTALTDGPTRNWQHDHHAKDALWKRLQFYEKGSSFIWHQCGLG